MIKFILEYLFVFIVGSLIGYMLELIYRNFGLERRKWTSPGTLSGPYLPLYGGGLCTIYIISKMSIHFSLKVLMFAIVTTFLEYITGLYLLKVNNMRLWDYSHNKFNVHGLITPLYTFFWTILSLIFYFILYPFLYNITQYLYKNLELSLIIGIILGAMMLDGVQSFNLNLERRNKMLRK